MKNIFLLIFLLINSHLYSQSESKMTDPNLFGTWSGSEKDGQEKGMTKNWIMHRFEDGTFVLLFTTVKDNEIDNFSEKGRWWVDEKGIFNEYHNNSKLTDQYSYKVLDANNVKFKAKSMAMEMSNQEYEFIDTRVLDGV